MSNSEVISDIRSALRLVGADIGITDRTILSRARKVSYKYIKQALDKRKLWDSPNIFTPLKVQMEQHPLADYCEYQSDCMIARSVHKLPKLQEGLYSISSQGLFSLKKLRKFTEVSPQRYANLLALNLPGNNIYYWFFNDYLCMSESTIESVILPSFIEGDAAKEFSVECSDDSCPTNPLEQDFKAPGYMMEDIINGTADWFMKTYKRAHQDDTSDDNDESK